MLRKQSLKVLFFCEAIMIQCQTCGQANSQESNFCRFCGSAVPQLSKNKQFDFAPPRHYAWKTDEFQISKSKARKTESFNQVQPLVYQPPPANQKLQTQSEIYQQPQWIAQGYHCPRCSSQLMPKIERKISTAGWIVFAVLLITFFPLFWIGFLIKEDVRVCPVCNLRVS
jgi:hypothetical protein